MTTRILLADGEPLFREGLAQLLAGQRGFELVGEACDSEEALTMARGLHPDLALVAMDLPGLGGSETARLLHSACPHTTIIILAPPRSEESPRIPSGEEDGALVRSVRASQAFAQIRRLAAQRGSRDAPSLAATVFPAFRTGTPDEQLTPRERAVFELIAEGWSNRQIENALGIRESTVKRHVRRILRKLHVRNRVQAAVYAVRSSMLQREGALRR